MQKKINKIKKILPNFEFKYTEKEAELYKIQFITFFEKVKRRFACNPEPEKELLYPFFLACSFVNAIKEASIPIDINALLLLHDILLNSGGDVVFVFLNVVGAIFYSKDQKIPKSSIIDFSEDAEAFIKFMSVAISKSELLEEVDPYVGAAEAAKILGFKDRRAFNCICRQSALPSAFKDKFSRWHCLLSDLLAYRRRTKYIFKDPNRSRPRKIEENI